MDIGEPKRFLQKKEKEDTEEQAFIDFIGSGKSVKVVHVTN